MLRDRIKELVDFATTESPYRQATKGWINEDIYLELGSPKGNSSKSGEELAEVAVFWKPINQMFLLLFLVLSLATIFVFVSLSLSRGSFNISMNSQSLLKAPEPVEMAIQPASSDSEALNSMPQEAALEPQEAALEPQEPALEKEAQIDKKSRLNTQLANAGLTRRPSRFTTAQDLFQPKHP